MSLKNIQRSKKQKVLNRPMFAKMRDGSVKPVQYAWGGLAVSGLNLASKALPYAGRGLSAIKNTLPSIITKGKNLITRGGSKSYRRRNRHGCRSLLRRRFWFTCC